MNFSFFNILMFACFYLIVPVVYVMMRNETKQKKNIVLGTTLPFGADNDPEVKKICAEFIKGLNIVSVVLTVFALIMFFFSLSSYVLIYMSVWMILAMVFLYVPYVKANGKLRRLKLEKGWYSDIGGKVIVDIKTAGQQCEKISTLWFVIPSVLAFIPVFAEIYKVSMGTGELGMIILYVIFACIVAMCYVAYAMIFRVRSDNVSENSWFIAALTGARRRFWGKTWLWMAWLTAALNIAFFLFYDNMYVVLGATGVYTVALIYVCMRAEFNLRAVQRSLTEKYGIDSSADDDRYWIWGVFYHNPNDNHLFVNNRVGMNMTINLAKGAGKVLGVLSVLAILMVPALGVYLLNEETTPVNIYITDNAVVAEHLSTVYTVSFDEITQIESIDELNTNFKIWGTGMDNVYKGKFRVDGYGSCTLCLDPRADSFAVITTEKGETYIFSPGSDVMAEIKDKLN